MIINTDHALVLTKRASMAIKEIVDAANDKDPVTCAEHLDDAELFLESVIDRVKEWRAKL